MKDKMLKEQLNLSIPSAFEYVVVTLISMVDVFFLSTLGSIELAAVGAMVPVISFVNLLTKSIQVSDNVLLSKQLTKKNDSKLKLITGNAVILAIIFQILCVSITLLISPALPIIFKVDKICLTYLYIRLIGSIPSTITFIVSGHISSLGKSKEMLYINVFTLIMNIILDYYFIKYGYGVAGVAISTVIVETINMLILIPMSKEEIKYKIDNNIMNEILDLTKHGLLDRSFDRGSKLIVNIILSRLGTFEYAAHVILNQIESFVNDFCYGFGLGITTNVGMKYSKDKNIDKIENAINKVTYTLVLILPIVILIFSIIFLPMLLKDEKSLLIAKQLLPLVIFYALLMPIKYKTSGIIEGLKEFKYNGRVSSIVNASKVILSFILSMTLGIKGVWLTFIICYIILILLLKRRINIVLSKT